ncbi:GNAT family N-acetyltransferase [Inquilinus limosus]|uniref:GNAT family N-acetyltransferase n=1 Tax=Inquilinus limosus TaxID=171674 RepID=UPI001B7FD90F|nr:GNAT family N-acetyltransferase [Inquilinus limosus]
MAHVTGAARRPAPALTFRPVDAASWPDFERLFESRGAPKYCWCMAWRATPQEVRLDSAGRKAALHARVRDGVPIGIVGYHEGEPVAWCSIAPRETYRPLGGPQDGERVWSLACMFVPRRLRGLGLADQLIAAAVEHARAQGATVVEAYPVDPDSPSYRFMGFVQAFARAGFTEIGRAGSRRHVMRLRLSQ